MRNISLTYSTLRRGRKLPPPPTSEYNVNNIYCEATPTALLHSAYAVRGRAFSWLCPSGTNTTLS